MNDYFKSLFNRQPIEIIDGDYYYNTDNEGDQFDESDAKLWLEEGIFKTKWDQAGQTDNRRFSIFYEDILKYFLINLYLL